MSHAVLTVVRKTVPWGLAETACVWTEQNLPHPHHHLEHFQPSMHVRGKHSHEGCNLPNSSLSHGQSRQQSRVMRETKEWREGVTEGPVSKDLKFIKVISRKVRGISWTQPPACPLLFSAGHYVQGSDNPPAWIAAMLREHEAATSSLLDQ